MYDLSLNTNPDFQHHRIDYTTDNCDEVKHIPSIFEEVLWTLFVFIWKKRNILVFSIDFGRKYRFIAPNIPNTVSLVYNGMFKRFMLQRLYRFRVKYICKGIILPLGTSKSKPLTSIENVKFSSEQLII